MHIAHILRKYEPAQWGGTETAVLRLIQGLQSHGATSSVHAPRHSLPFVNDPMRQAGTPGSVDVAVTSPRPMKSSILRSPTQPVILT